MLVKGNEKTRLRLKQLSLLIFPYTLIYEAKHFQWLLKGYCSGNSPLNFNFHAVKTGVTHRNFLPPSIFITEHFYHLIVYQPVASNKAR